MSAKKENKKTENLTELRQDPVTESWVVIAINRAKRPEDFIKKQKKEVQEDLTKKCFFCYPEETGQKKDTLIYQDSQGNWTLRVFPNKYPAFVRPKNEPIHHQEEGPYFKMQAVGYHEIVVTRDHKKQLANLDVMEVAEVIDAFQERYIDLMNKKSVNYIEIFQNYGKEAGASVTHPHSQIMAIPVIPSQAKTELKGAEKYYRMNKECIYCAIIEWEKENKERVIFENDEYLVFCPYASRVAFETWIIPKKHKPYFERTNQSEKLALAEALKMALKKIYQALDNPAYNFYFRTSPADGQDYPHFHWHLEILPKTAIWAGFELSTGIEISTIEPEVAAKYLREI